MLGEVCLVNEAVLEAEESPSTFVVVEDYIANEATPDRMVQLAPFGDFPNVGGLQRFRPEDAQSIVDDFEDPTNLEARGLGLPWYVGHPDFDKLSAKYTDHKAKGRIKKLVVKHDLGCPKCRAMDNDDPCRQHGLFAKVKWNDEGRQLIKDEAFHGHSVNWRIRRDPNGIARPTSLKSVGFTNDPQIPVPAITSANESQSMNKLKTLIDWIKKLTGKDITENTADDKLVNELEDFYANTYTPMKAKMDGCAANETAAKDKVKDMGFTVPADMPMIIFLANEVVAGRGRETTVVNERQQAATKLTESEGKVTSLTQERDNLANEKRTAAEGHDTAIKAEKGKRAKLIARLGVTEGRLSAAQESTFANEIMADPDAGLTRLEGMQRVWNNRTQVGNLGGRSSQTIANEAARRDKIQELVNERMAQHKETYDVAYNKVKTANPALFQEMADDAITKKRKA